MGRVALNEWILAWKAQGYWCQQCPGCGWWYAQKHRNRGGRRSVICGKHRCSLWWKYRNINGRAPPEWLLHKWKSLWGDAPRTTAAKRHKEPTWCEAAA